MRDRKGQRDTVLEIDKEREREHAKDLMKERKNPNHVHILSYHHRYKEETVEELSVERAAVMPSFVMAESDRVTKVSCFYNCLSLCYLCFIILISYHGDASESAAPARRGCARRSR